MATPVTLGQIETMMRTLGHSDIAYSPGATTADRPGEFDPIGVTIHITAGGLGSRSEQQYIRDIINADPNVPLKANAVGGVKGRIWLNAVGNGNHCLYFSAQGLRLTQQQGWPLRPGFHDVGGGIMKWSLRSYGIEMIAASGSKVTDTMRQAAIVWAAAICILHGWSAGVVHGHGEIAQDRSVTDPGIDMGRFRMDVQRVIDRYHRPDQPQPVPPVDQPEKLDPLEELMSMSAADRAKLIDEISDETARKVWQYQLAQWGYDERTGQVPRPTRPMTAGELASRTEMAAELGARRSAGFDLNTGSKK